MTLFFELLRVAIGTQKDLSRTPSPEEWESVINTFSKQGMLAICANGIKKLPSNQRPTKVQYMQCLAAASRVQQYNELLNKSCLKLQTTLKNYGFGSCILKGQGLGMYYGEMTDLRQPGDIDVWMWPINEDGSLKPLSRWLRRKEIYEFAKKCPNPGKPVYHNVAVKYLNNISLELHFTPSWFFSPLKNLHLQRWFEDQAPEQFQNKVELLPDRSINSASLDFNRIYVLIHIFRHFLGDGIGVRQLLDYFFVLRSSNNYDKAKTRELLRNFGMERFAGAVTWILKEQMGLEDEFLFCHPDAREGAFLLNEVRKAVSIKQSDSPTYKNKHTGNVGTFFKRTSQNFRFLTHYTDEVLWCPLWKIWHQLWLKKFRK